MLLDNQLRECIKWWIENVKTSYKPIVRSKPDFVLKSDSSKTGWGGLVDKSELKTGGHWSYIEQLRHINELELLAAFLTLKCFCTTKQNMYVRIYWTIQLQYSTLIIWEAEKLILIILLEKYGSGACNEMYG